MMILHGNVSSEYIFDFKKTHHRRKVMNKIIKINIIFCVVLVVAFACSAGAYASIVGIENENVQENSLPIASEEAKQSTRDHISASTEATSTIVLSFKPDKYRRTVIIGDLPTDHDPSLVLRKGRTIAVQLNGFIKNEASLGQGSCTLNIKSNVYDDSGQVLLMPILAKMDCFYKVFEEQDKLRINFTILGMRLDLHPNINVRFSDPPHHTTNGERMKQMLTITPISSADMKKREEEFLRLREQLFLSPVMSAELIIGVESEDRKSVLGRVIFDKNASGNRTVTIESGYIFNLQIEKDLLFSGPFVPKGRTMDRIIKRTR
jgi:hypothetical protein